MAASPTCPEGDNPIKKLDSPLNGTLQTETTCDESSSPPTQELQTKVQGSPSRTASPRLETDQPGAPEPTSTEILPVSQTSILAQDQENVIKLQADTKVLRLQFQEVRRLRRITTEGKTILEFAEDSKDSSDFVLRNLPGKVEDFETSTTVSEAYQNPQGEDEDEGLESFSEDAIVAKEKNARKELEIVFESKTEAADSAKTAEEEASKPEPPILEPEEPAYNLSPRYVLELVDTRDQEILLRKDSVLPFEDAKSKYSTRDKSSEHNHIFEIVHTKETGTLLRKERDIRDLPIASKGIRITSPLLRRVLHEVIRHSPDFDFDGWYIEEPYMAIYHYRTQILGALADKTGDSPEAEDKETAKHVRALLDFLFGHMDAKVQQEMERHKRNPPVATFRNYWMAFKAGSKVFWRSDEMDSVWVIKDITGGPASGFDKDYVISLYNINFDGHKLGNARAECTVSPWTGERRFDRMPLMPVSLEEDREMSSRYTSLIERGKKFVEMVKPTYWFYRGKSARAPRRMYNTTVMVDTSYCPWEESPHKDWLPEFVIDREPQMECNCPLCEEARSLFQSTGYMQEDKENITLTDDQYALCSPWVLGYMLSARKWEVLAVDNLEPCADDRDLITKLALDDESKQMIKAICHTYALESIQTQRTAWSADIVAGKGEGQIFLLHGKPGVGKSLTAECVAGYTQRPLLALSPADIGTEPSQVEERLSKFLKMGERWGAIVLLDEADVYLEARDVHDLERNGLVSVFLRLLEYYQGVLFITTNRVGTFDEAFVSRIHVSIHYGDLSDESREKIWNNMIEKLYEDRDDIVIDERAETYMKANEQLRKLEWNGRQIRNGFQTTVSLAEYDTEEAMRSGQSCKWCRSKSHLAELCGTKHPEKKGKKVLVKLKHIEQVVKMSRRFIEYLEDLHHVSFSERANQLKLRSDDFKDNRKP